MIIPQKKHGQAIDLFHQAAYVMVKLLELLVEQPFVLDFDHVLHKGINKIRSPASTARLMTII